MITYGFRGQVFHTYSEDRRASRRKRILRAQFIKKVFCLLLDAILLDDTDDAMTMRPKYRLLCVELCLLLLDERLLSRNIRAAHADDFMPRKRLKEDAKCQNTSWDLWARSKYAEDELAFCLRSPLFDAVVWVKGLGKCAKLEPFFRHARVRHSFNWCWANKWILSKFRFSFLRYSKKWKQTKWFSRCQLQHGWTIAFVEDDGDTILADECRKVHFYMQDKILSHKFCR